MNILMVGVGPKRIGGMWSVSEQYINSEYFNKKVKLYYVKTSTLGSIFRRILCMIFGYLKIFYILLFKKIDIVHLHMAEKGSVYRKGFIAKLSKKMNKKVIIHMHAGPFMAYYKTISERSKKNVLKILNCYSDKVIVLGNYWMNQMSEIVSKDKLVVLYNGVDIPEKNQYSENNKNIVYFGVMNKNKGIYDLIETIEKINDKLDNSIKIRLCGKDLTGDVERLIDEKKLNNRIYYLGWIDGEKKEQELKNAMISVLPSYYEGLSMTIIEAMSYGIPVITTNISTMNEILNNEKFLFNPGDTEKFGELILYLASKKEERNKISHSEYERVKKIFSNKIFIEKTLEIYDNLMQ